MLNLCMKIKSPTLPITAEPVLTIYSYFSARLRIRPYRGLRIQPAGAWQLPHLPGIELLTGHSAGADARKVCFVCLAVQRHRSAPLGNLLLIGTGLADLTARLCLSGSDPVAVFHIALIHNEIPATVLAPLDALLCLGHTVYFVFQQIF